MSLLLSAFTIGFILSLLALGVYISFKIFEFPDITAEGTITTGAAVAAVLLVHKWPPMAAMGIAMIAGAAAGLITGMLAMTALYSINLRIMDKSNIPLMNEHTIVAQADEYGKSLFGGANVVIWGW